MTEEETVEEDKSSSPVPTEKTTTDDLLHDAFMTAEDEENVTQPPSEDSAPQSPVEAPSPASMSLVDEPPSPESDLRTLPTSPEQLVQPVTATPASDELPPPIQSPSDSVDLHHLQQQVVATEAENQQLQTPSLPPIVADEFVMSSHELAHYCWAARQMSHEGHFYASVGSMSVLNEGTPGIIHANRAGASMSALSDLDIVSTRLGQTPPENMTEDWDLHQICMEVAVVEFGARAAVIHGYGLWSEAFSIDETTDEIDIGNFGDRMGFSVIPIIDMSDDPSEDHRAIRAGLSETGNRIVSLRGQGILSIGPTIIDAWNNLACLERACHTLGLRLSLDGSSSWDEEEWDEEWDESPSASGPSGPGPGGPGPGGPGPRGGPGPGGPGPGGPGPGGPGPGGPGPGGPGPGGPGPRGPGGPGPRGPGGPGPRGPGPPGPRGGPGPRPMDSDDEGY